ncbi:tetratricopeptide repeat protein [bacterium]|nr:tetratricopeptide repeat protein [bacterium]
MADESKALELDPANAYPWAKRAALRAKKGDLEGAIADGTKAIDLDPGSFVPLFDRATAYEKKGDREHALDDLVHALPLAPDEASAARTRAAIEELRAKLGR